MFQKPIGDVSFRGRTEAEGDKHGKHYNEMLDILEPHIREIVKMSFAEEQKEFESSGEKEKFDQGFRELEDHLKSPEGQVKLEELKEMCEAHWESLSEEERLELEAKAERLENLTEEERNKAEEEEFILDLSWKATSTLAKSVLFDCCILFEDGGAQCLDISEFVDGIDFEWHRLEIARKFHPEVRRVLKNLIPALFKDNIMDTVGDRGVELFYSESSEKLVIREVSWEMLQTWANS